MPGAASRCVCVCVCVCVCISCCRACSAAYISAGRREASQTGDTPMTHTLFHLCWLCAMLWQQDAVL